MLSCNLHLYIYNMIHIHISEVKNGRIDIDLNLTGENIT